MSYFEWSFQYIYRIFTWKTITYNVGIQSNSLINNLKESVKYLVEDEIWNMILKLWKVCIRNILCRHQIFPSDISTICLLLPFSNLNSILWILARSLSSYHSLQPGSTFQMLFWSQVMKVCILCSHFINRIVKCL